MRARRRRSGSSAGRVATARRRGRAAGARAIVPALLTRMSTSMAVARAPWRRARRPRPRSRGRRGRPVNERPGASTRALRLAAGGVEAEARADDVGAGGGQRLGHRQADPAPAARDERDLAGEVEHHAASPAQSIRIFIASPGSSASNAAARLGERHDVGDQRVDRDRALGEQADRLLEVGALVDARADRASARARRRGRGRPAAASRGWRRRRAARARRARRSRSRCPATAPETSNATSAPAPSVHSST